LPRCALRGTRAIITGPDGAAFNVTHRTMTAPRSSIYKAALDKAPLRDPDQRPTRRHCGADKMAPEGQQPLAEASAMNGTGADQEDQAESQAFCPRLFTAHWVCVHHSACAVQTASTITPGTGAAWRWCCRPPACSIGIAGDGNQDVLELHIDGYGHWWRWREIVSETNNIILIDTLQEFSAVHARIEGDPSARPKPASACFAWTHHHHNGRACAMMFGPARFCQWRLHHRQPHSAVVETAGERRVVFGLGIGR